jgi:sugar lactone lactonase YvrE
MSPDLTVKEVIKGGCGIPNGISWSKDEKTMYFTDSTKLKIFAYDFDAETGSISNETTFYQPTEGVPDGHAVDEEGYLWVAQYGGSRVCRVSPKGEVVAEVVLPVKNITDVAFVGEDIFITCATDQQAQTTENQGDVFKCHVGIKGAPLTKFPLSSSEAKL